MLLGGAICSVPGASRHEILWGVRCSYFNAAADFQKGIGAHGKEIMGDIPNYTDLAPQIQVSEIVVA